MWIYFTICENFDNVYFRKYKWSYLTQEELEFQITLEEFENADKELL